MKAVKIMENILKNGGTTVTANGNRIKAKQGYMVSLPDHETVLPIEDNATIIDMIDKKLKSIPNGAMLGGWVDGDRVYLDYSVKVADRERAIKIGKKYGQLAIYDIANCNVITL